MFSLDRGTPPKCYHLKCIICCIDEMEVSPLVPDPEAVALPAHADGEVAPWESHLHTSPVESSHVKRYDNMTYNLLQFFARSSVIYCQGLVL